MATVLPFDPEFRRRTPPRPRAAVPPTVRPRRDTPIPRRAARAVVHGVAAYAAAEGARVSEQALAARFFPVVALAAGADLLTKLVAVTLLGDGSAYAAGPLALQLVYNPGTAGGLMLGAHTRALNVAATGVILGLLVMLVPALARVDRRSTAALALVAGGGLGNLVSLATSPRGVEDFLAWRHAHGAVVINVADLAIAAGLVLLARTAWALVRAVRTHGPGARLAAVLPR